MATSYKTENNFESPTHPVTLSTISLLPPLLHPKPQPLHPTRTHPPLISHPRVIHNAHLKPPHQLPNHLPHLQQRQILPQALKPPTRRHQPDLPLIATRSAS